MPYGMDRTFGHLLVAAALMVAIGCSSQSDAIEDDEETAPSKPDAHGLDVPKTPQRADAEVDTIGEDSRQDAGSPRDSSTPRSDGSADAPPTDAEPREAQAEVGRLPDVAAPETAASDASEQGDAPSGYRLVWSDEFDGEGGPDSTNWSFESGFVRNQEAQWYQPDNARVADGMLVIEARRERVENPNYRSGDSDWKRSRRYAEYTASSMHSRGKRSFRYGRFEMRARIPTQAGVWPAWWTLGNDGEWPSNGEIDIMEFYRGNLLANVACGTSTRWNAKWDSSSKSLASLGGQDWANQFHVWRMDWDDKRIILSVDDRELNRTNLDDMLNPDGKSPFRQPHYMLLNVAIGGVNGGDPSKTTFPVRLEVDYVRVYQRE